MDLIRMILTDTKRLAFALVFTAVLLYVFMTNTYEVLSTGMQLYAFTMLRLLTGVIVGHIVGKTIFGSVDWKNAKITDANAVGRLISYALSIYAFVNM